MTGLSEPELTDMLPVGNWLELASWVVRIFLVMLASCAALLGSLVLIARIIHAKTLNQLQGLPQIRQHFPFQGMWIIQGACNQHSSRVGFGTKTIMGTTIHAQSNENNPYSTAVNRLAEIFMERVFTPLLQVNFIFQLTSKGREYKKCLKVLHTFTRKVIAERKEALRNEIEASLITLEEDAPSTDVGRKTPRPFMDLLLLEHFKGNITDDGIREEVDTFMFAGHDTTAVGISWALFLIGHYPEKQQLIHDELDFIFGDDRDRYVTSEDLKQMKYFECALKESQRIYPSAPMISRLCTEPFTTGGVTFPKNSVVQVGTYFLHRDPEVFPKPEEFVPERFLPDNAKRRHPYGYVPFSGGLRNCIGQKFALAEEKIVIANILRRFKIKSLDQRDQVPLAAEIVLRPRSGLRIEFTPR